MARIIAADDNKITQMFYENILEFLGHEYKICSNGEEVIEEFIRKPVDLLILDYQMPKMDGFEVCRKLRASAEGITVPIIIVSAMQDEETIMEGLDAGATDYLLKPVTEAHLIAKLKNYLNTSSLHRKDLDLVKSQTVFAGHYKIEKLLGYGSHSVVFLAKDRKNNDADVAIKLLHENSDTVAIAPTFMETASRMRNLNSENILKILDSGQYGGRLYLIMEYANQKDLASLLKTRTLTDRETALLISSMLEALKTLKENNLVHFDIKPENILIKDNLFKLGDFGIVPSANAKSTISLDKGNVWTTMSYLAPENLNLSTDQTFSPDIRCDIYSLGVTAYESFSGDNPFDSDKLTVSIHRQLSYVPPPLHVQTPAILRILSDAIESMLRKNPEERAELDQLLPAFVEINAYLATKNPVLVGYTTGSEAKPEEQKPVGNAGPAQEPSKSEPAEASEPVLEPLSKTYFRELPYREAYDFKYKALRLIAAVAILAVSTWLSLTLYKFMLNKMTPVDDTASIYAVKCRSCGQFQEMNITDIKNAKCQFCKKTDLCYMMTCDDCGNVFPFRNEYPKDVKSKEEMIEALQQMNRCPSCGSSKIEPSYTNIKMLKKFKSEKK